MIKNNSVYLNENFGVWRIFGCSCDGRQLVVECYRQDQLAVTKSRLLPNGYISARASPGLLSVSNGNSLGKVVPAKSPPPPSPQMVNSRKPDLRVITSQSGKSLMQLMLPSFFTCAIETSGSNRRPSVSHRSVVAQSSASESTAALLPVTDTEEELELPRGCGVELLCDLTEHECDTVNKRITPPMGLTQWHRCCDESRKKENAASVRARGEPQSIRATDMRWTDRLVALVPGRFGLWRSN
ncbi:Myocyte-specific enhancer factor 2D -like protein [Collichthys lucidus]|uniref:Myocyte-specific enhancer factor 2D-like protein n=1 Tax=Collichthys lucidus TaxID=240159 RepID=A0A4U5V5Q7_COLLU|nr:Myocyte-specific enhancer factor 2D -like protein [Collichthys lucidus]